MNTILHKLLATGISVAGGFVGSQLVSAGWRVATGHSAPHDATDEELPIVEALSFAFISAGISALIRVAGQRGAGTALRALQEKTAQRVNNEV
ncbi:MAG: DUF4235 domain-containing protein [Micrococcus sp.]|nr:DUF4235 domain-containing protein [Micrococcus sp.]